MRLFKIDTPNQGEKFRSVTDALQHGTKLEVALADARLNAKDYLAILAAQHPRAWDTDLEVAKDILKSRKDLIAKG